MGGYNCTTNCQGTGVQPGGPSPFQLKRVNGSEEGGAVGGTGGADRLQNAQQRVFQAETNLNMAHLRLQQVQQAAQSKPIQEGGQWQTVDTAS
ncbi:MAG: hypothetical protein SFZ03_08070 [Candidatus Melainabacteria bacterium]|nr:hypothetical protein [Candidatus Melainabacteria bacterium]